MLFINQTIIFRQRAWIIRPFLPELKFSSGHADGVGTAARFWLPFQGAVDEEGNLFVAELLNHTIRKITPDGMVSTFAGVPQKKGFLDGKPLDAKFNEPWA